MKVKNSFAKELSFNELEKILPELGKIFPAPPHITVTDVFLPDGKACCYETNPENAWLHLKAIQQSYDEVGELLFDTEQNDWFITINDKKFFWANGRILPKDKILLADEYKPFFSYTYVKRIFEVSKNDKEYFSKIFKDFPRKKKNIKNPRSKNSYKPNYFFLTEIYGKLSEKAIKEKLREIWFLGTRVYVHKRVAKNLKSINAKLLKYKKQGQLKYFFSNYATTYGFNWRQIEYTDALSNHAIGIAVDVMAKYYGNLSVFWFWSSIYNKEWFMLKKNQRWHPPKEVVDAFNDEGFIWGGYWTLWDTMHFEYKPELIWIYDFTYTE